MFFKNCIGVLSKHNYTTNFLNLVTAYFLNCCAYNLHKIKLVLNRSTIKNICCLILIYNIQTPQINGLRGLATLSVYCFLARYLMSSYLKLLLCFILIN